jgi:hypothetical protein
MRRDFTGSIVIKPIGPGVVDIVFEAAGEKAGDPLPTGFPVSLAVALPIHSCEIRITGITIALELEVLAPGPEGPSDVSVQVNPVIEAPSKEHPLGRFLDDIPITKGSGWPKVP